MRQLLRSKQSLLRTDKILMKIVVLFILILNTSFVSAMDSFSINKYLGANGDLGQDTLQLICVKEQCLATSTHNDKIINQKSFKYEEAKKIFQNIFEDFKEEKTPKKESLSNISFVLEFKGKVLKSTYATAELQAAELKIKQSLRP